VSEKEKELRGNLKSEVQKLISKENLLILDSLNYIKGFRYELYCVSKLCQTPQCIIYTDTDVETCSKWNSSEASGYKDEV
jgi:protein KTI12